jgi:hypothetical protein
MKIELERKPTSGGSFSVYDRWTDSANNISRFTSSGSCSVSTGYTYRTKVTDTVNGEEVVTYSSEMKY